MKNKIEIGLFVGLMLFAVSAQNLFPPEVVQLENVLEEGEMKTVYVGNSTNHYFLYCNTKAAHCITPEENKNYLLFNSNTRWKMPGGKVAITLAELQDWTIKYNKGENVGLVPQDDNGDIGIFILDPTGGGYERDIIIADGPIIYGTNMNDVDRQRAWKHFFMRMIEAVVRQQGQDALGVKLARRCQPGQDFCTTSLDANFIGVAGIQEPRKVLVVVLTDVHDQTKHLQRTVCTYPAKGTVICRDWDTGKLISAKHAQQ
jgi:hypothetical protein